MMTKVILDGVMGKEFGREWNLAVNSPAEAIRLIDANKPGLIFWIRDNLAKYECYEVSCKYDDDTEELLNDDTYLMNRKVKEIRFTPLVTGAGGKGGGIAQIVVGLVIIVAAVVTYGAALAAVPAVLAGGAMVVSGVMTLVTSMPKINDVMSAERKDGTSYYFDGPVNTSMQGVPIPLVYGRCLSGSHPISVDLNVDEKVAQ